MPKPDLKKSIEGLRKATQGLQSLRTGVERFRSGVQDIASTIRVEGASATQQPPPIREELVPSVTEGYGATETNPSAPTRSQSRIGSHGVPEASALSPPTTAETVAYQNREIGKQLFALERHYAQRMRIAGKACDCGSTKHLLGVEQLAEETIPMVHDLSVYEEIINWVRENEPKSTDEAAKSGKYDNEYPSLSQQARDFRKKITGTLSLNAIIEPKREISLKEAKAEAARIAAERVEKQWQSTQKT